MKNPRYIGLMSGTSMDAVDAALIEVEGTQIRTLATFANPLPPSLRNAILALTQPGENEIVRMGQLDNQIGELFAETVNTLLKTHHVSAKEINAIGSHGQTIRHHPHPPLAFTLQIGNPNIISQRTGITTIADFRRRDIAAGGQGAPLVPALHAHLFRSSTQDRVVVNLGGIANITVLPADTAKPVIGYDTGPANCLLDSNIQRYMIDALYDYDGNWAAEGMLNQALLDSMLEEPYLSLPPPKSTGRELFHLAWVEEHITKCDADLTPVDVQATLMEYTAKTVSDAIKQHAPAGSEVLLCGGGSLNKRLVARLRALLPDFTLQSTAAYGVDPSYVEAIAFAWMAHATLHHLPSNLPSVTGATMPVILGGIYLNSATTGV